MPTLHFSRVESLKLALASGVVPAAVASASAFGGVDDAGGCWVTAAELPRESAAALARYGATVHPPGSGPPPRPLLAWAELVPLKSAAGLLDGHALTSLPDAQVASFVARLRRQGMNLLGLRLTPDGSVVVVTDRLPSHFASALADRDVEVFREGCPGVWVADGFTHPLIDSLCPAPGEAWLLSRGRPWRAWPMVPPLTPASPRLGTPTAKDELPTPLRHAVVLRLTQATESAAATLWLGPGGTAGLAELLRHMPGALLGKYRVATLDAPGRAAGVTVLLREPGSVTLIAQTRRLAGFAAHPQCPTLFLPTGSRLTPTLRPRCLAELFELRAGHLTVLAPHGGSWRPVRVPTVSLRDLRDAIDYEVPGRREFRVAPPATAWLGLPAFVAEAERPPARAKATPPREPAEAAPTPSRLRDWLRRRKPRNPRPQSPGVDPSAGTPGKTAPANDRRDKLVSPVTPSPGHEWARRQRDLERRVLDDLPRLAPPGRAALWSELAEVYATVGEATDAAVCRLNAAWGGSPDSAAAWLAAECRAARVAPQHVTAATLVAAPDTVPMAAVTAAYLASAVAPGPEIAQLVDRVTRHETDLPARGVWLARLGAARAAGGDPLGLAKTHDRLFARLRDRGSGLDLDAPAFLRFEGVAAGDRLTLAREWLSRVREPVHRWLGKLASPGRLRWAGLDGEVTCTTAYADLMLAWGLAKVGDRAAARALEVAATAALQVPATAGVDPRVHPHLLQRFLSRVRDARVGRADADTGPREAPPGTDALGRYAIDALRAQSRILEPRGGVDPFESRDALGFLGTDALGMRLAEFLRPRRAIHNPDDARRLLAIDESDPTAATMPRVIFALLEAAPRLDPQLVSAVIPQTLRAIELIPEWVRLGNLGGDPATLTDRYGRRMLLAACHAATLFRLSGSLRAATEQLVERCDTPDGPTARLFEPVAGPYFRALGRLGLEPLAELIVAKLRPGMEAGPRELGLAVGYFVAGQPDAANAILDAARDRLFVTGVRDDRDRTATALAYAAALEHAPPRTALGRLEELFLRLDMVTATGATNRYFTLAPLALIDVAIRAVVSEEFTPGPRVRAWLDDDEYLTRRRVSRDLDDALKSL